MYVYTMYVQKQTYYLYYYYFDLVNIIIMKIHLF